MHDAYPRHMSTTEKKRSIVPLVEGKHDDLQVVRLDGDQFILTAQEAIDACSLASNSARFQVQFEELLDHLYPWVEFRKGLISAAFISVSHEGILFLVVQRDVKSDFQMEDELVELDLEIANSECFDLVPFNTLLVPHVGDEVLQSFLSSGTTVSHSVNAQRS